MNLAFYGVTSANFQVALHDINLLFPFYFEYWELFLSYCFSLWILFRIMRSYIPRLIISCLMYFQHITFIESCITNIYLRSIIGILCMAST